MSATTAVPPDVAAYLDAVRDALGDLPVAEREDLVAEVELSILDAASEGGAIAARLGPPEEFAAELRAAAGLDAPGLAPAGTGALLARASQRASAWWTSGRTAAVRRVLGELAPLWWVVRGYIAVAAFALLTDAGWTNPYPSIPRLGNGQGGVAVVALGVAVSLLFGLASRHRRDLRPLAAVANVVLVLAAVPVAGHVADGARAEPIVLAPVAAPIPAGLAYDGIPLDNLYPYSRDGKLLHDVLLYDGRGQPLELRPGAPDPDRRIVLGKGGEPLYNAFPIRYFEPGTTVVAEPDAAPRIFVPTVLTPPLETGSTP